MPPNFSLRLPRPGFWEGPSLQRRTSLQRLERFYASRFSRIEQAPRSQWASSSTRPTSSDYDPSRHSQGNFFSPALGSPRRYIDIRGDGGSPTLTTSRMSVYFTDTGIVISSRELAVERSRRTQRVPGFPARAPRSPAPLSPPSTPKGRVPSEILFCTFTFPLTQNPIQRHHAWSVALAGGEQKTHPPTKTALWNKSVLIWFNN